MFRIILTLLISTTLFCNSYAMRHHRAKSQQLKSAAPAGMSVSINLSGNVGDTDTPAPQYELKEVVKSFPEKQWITLQDKTTNQPVVLLARLENKDEKQVTLDFIVLSTDDKPMLLAAPKMVLIYGQKGKLTINNANRQLVLRLDVLASR